MNRVERDHAWAAILSRCDLADPRPALVTTADMKRWTGGLEPRLLAKMDSLADVPRPLRDAGRFLFPVSGRGYALVTGDGFHVLEPPAPPRRWSWGTAARFTTLALGSGESRALDTALHTGMIEAAFDLPARPALTARGRRFAPPFSFRCGDHRVEVGRGVQFELDAGLDAGGALVLLEAKVGAPADFWIRQLYVPWRAYRAWCPGIDLRPGFLVFDDASGEYRFRRYRQGDPDRHGDLELVSAHTFVLAPDAPVDLAALRAATPERRLPEDLQLPQADRFERVLEIPALISVGRDDPAEIASTLGFSRRQGAYYLRAARSLGLVEVDGPARLTPEGHALARALPGRREPLAATALLGLPVLRDALAAAGPGGRIHRPLLERVAAARAPGTDGTSTLPRRARTLHAWLRWLALRVDGLRETDGGFVRDTAPLTNL